jgi:uncharacterized protein (TIGR02302 family)
MTEGRESPPGGENVRRRLARLVAQSWHALLWERIWPPLAATLVVAGLFLAVSWAGLWISLPPLARIFGLVLFALLLTASLWPFTQLKLPQRAAALARLDHSSGMDHRPATTIADSLATSGEDPVMQALWRAHRSRAAQMAEKLRVAMPKPRLALRDPYAIRSIALLAAVATFFVAEGDHMQRVTAAFDWSGAITSKLYRVDAWVTPPIYTGRAPILLPGIRYDETAPGETAAVMIPAGSELVVRATGISSINLSAQGGLAEHTKERVTRVAEGGIERHFLITESGTLSVNGLPAGNVMWVFRAIPDRAPTIAFVKDPEITGRSSLSLNYRVEDDYGVSAAEARFTRSPDPAVPAAPIARPLVAPPDFPLILPQALTRAGVGQTTRDLADHPWAGATAILTLVARDEAGNEGMSEPREVRLPERPFTKAIARAIVEQRRNLAFDANAREQVGRALQALMLAPERFTPEAPVYLGLRTALTRLRLAKTDADLISLLDYFWEIAILIEDGTMSDADRDLRAAQDALRQAIDRGADEQEIQRLTERLREVMDRFLRALAEQLRRDNAMEERPLDRNTRVLRPQDLKSMLDRIESLARKGSKEAARKLLDELQAMLDGLSRSKQARGDQNDGGLSGQLDELGRMIQEQQRLRDRTFRQGRDSKNDRRNRGPDTEPTDRERRAYGELRGNQESLRQKLEQMIEQLKRQRQGADDSNGEGGGGPGKEADEALSRAEQAMKETEDALAGNDADGAVEGQGRALQNLRKGAQSLAEAMQDGMGDGMGEPTGESPESADRTDPLGRPMRSREYGDDFTVKVPGEIDIQRARRVLEELRLRLSDPNRSKLELDYLERLLHDF